MVGVIWIKLFTDDLKLSKSLYSEEEEKRLQRFWNMAFHWCNQVRGFFYPWNSNYNTLLLTVITILSKFGIITGYG